VGQRAEHRLQASASFMDKEQVVAIGVFVKVRHRLGRAAESKRDVVIDQKRCPAGDRVAACRKVLRFDMVMAGRLFGREFRENVAERRELADLCRWVRVVENGRDAGEAFRPEHLLGIERTVRLAKLCVPFTRNLSALNITWHDPTSPTCLTQRRKDARKGTKK